MPVFVLYFDISDKKVNVILEREFLMYLCHLRLSTRILSATQFAPSLFLTLFLESLMHQRQLFQSKKAQNLDLYLTGVFKIYFLPFLISFL